MVMSQKAYILFYIRKQPEDGHAGPAVPSRPSTAPPASQRTASLAREDSIKATLSSSGEKQIQSMNLPFFWEVLHAVSEWPTDL